MIALIMDTVGVDVKQLRIVVAHVIQGLYQQIVGRSGGKLNAAFLRHELWIQEIAQATFAGRHHADREHGFRRIGRIRLLLGEQGRGGEEHQQNAQQGEKADFLHGNASFRWKTGKSCG